MRYLIIVFLISYQLLAFEKFLFEENIKFKQGDLYFKNFETCKLDSKEIINICKKNNIIKDKTCVKTSYPSFFKHISQFSN